MGHGEESSLFLRDTLCHSLPALETFFGTLIELSFFPLALPRKRLRRGRPLGLSRVSASLQ